MDILNTMLNNKCIYLYYVIIVNYKRLGLNFLSEAFFKISNLSSLFVPIPGKPADLEDETHPDWVPSQNMGHTSQYVRKRKKDVGRKIRLDNRKKPKLEATEAHVYS